MPHFRYDMRHVCMTWGMQEGGQSTGSREWTEWLPSARYVIIVFPNSQRDNPTGIKACLRGRLPVFRFPSPAPHQYTRALLPKPPAHKSSQEKLRRPCPQQHAHANSTTHARFRPQDQHSLCQQHPTRPLPSGSVLMLLDVTRTVEAALQQVVSVTEREALPAPA